MDLPEPPQAQQHRFGQRNEPFFITFTDNAEQVVVAVDGNNHLLRIIGKGNKERLVPLPEPMLLSLRRLWKIHANPRWLFPTRTATGPVGRGTLTRTFAAAAQAAGI